MTQFSPQPDADIPLPTPMPLTARKQRELTQLAWQLYLYRQEDNPTFDLSDTSLDGEIQRETQAWPRPQLPKDYPYPADWALSKSHLRAPVNKFKYLATRAGEPAPSQPSLQPPLSLDTLSLDQDINPNPHGLRPFENKRSIFQSQRYLSPVIENAKDEPSVQTPEVARSAATLDTDFVSDFSPFRLPSPPQWYELTSHYVSAEEHPDGIRQSFRTQKERT